MRSFFSSIFTDSKRIAERTCRYSSSSDNCAAWQGPNRSGNSGGERRCRIACDPVAPSSRTRNQNSDRLLRHDPHCRPRCQDSSAPLRANWPGAAHLLLRSVQEHRAADGDHVAIAQNAEMRIVAVDLGAVGAVEVREDDLFLIFLNFQVKAADPLVGQLDVVPFLAADRDGRCHVVVQSPPVAPSKIRIVTRAMGTPMLNVVARP